MIHTARTAPAARPSKISSAERPGLDGRRPAGIAQWRSTTSRAGAAGTRREPGPGRPNASAGGGAGAEPVAGQEMSEATRLAAAHRVRLAGQRERPRARAADLARRQMPIDDRRALFRGGEAPRDL